MWLLGKCVFILNFFQSFLFFKIEIKDCLTVKGNQGLCRLEEDCTDVTESLISSGCSNDEICCPRRTISERMCYEYGDAVYGTSGALNLMAMVEEGDKEDECGITGVPLIIGGEKALPKEFPHMAAIGFGKNLKEAKWMCGGTLISEQYVLTAAHCLLSFDGKPRFVKLGVTNVENDRSEHLQIFKVKRYIYHPRYNRASSWDDIALLKLNNEVQFTPFARPACLDFAGKIREESALATGWGLTSVSSLKGSPDLMKVELNLIESSICNRMYQRTLKRNMSVSLLCAGILVGQKDTCQGDSGGPLVTVRLEPYCMYSLIGITSFGSVCGMGPAIYTRVFYYVPWIESVIWPQED